MFKPVSNPFETAIYANGMIESEQPNGANINIFPQVSGPITQVLVQEGQQVKAGTLLFTIEDSLQKANTELAEANLKAARDQYNKRRAAYDIDPKSVSKDVLDTAEDAVTQATAALKAANALLQYYWSKRRLTESCWRSTRQSVAMCHHRATMTLTPSCSTRSWS